MCGLGSATVMVARSACGSKAGWRRPKHAMLDAMPAEALEQAWPGGQTQPQAHLPSVEGDEGSASAGAAASSVA